MITFNELETIVSLDDAARMSAVLDYKYAVERAIAKLPPLKGGNE